MTARKYTGTRQSSCVNTRGIPPAEYQVLHLLSYPGVGGGGIPSQGTPPSGPGQGTPILTSLRGVCHPWMGVPHPGVPSHLDLARVPPSGPGWGTHSVWTWLGYPPSGPGRGTLPVWTWPGYPPPPPQVWTDKLKLLPSFILWMRAVKIERLFQKHTQFDSSMYSLPRQKHIRQ